MNNRTGAIVLTFAGEKIEPVPLFPATPVVAVDPQRIDADAIARAAAVLRAGGVAAFPTETIYGLGARADQPDALARLAVVKGRRPDKPFAILVRDMDAARALTDTLPPVAERLMRRCWPGPLTIIVPSRDDGTIGLRCPDHPIAQALMRATGVPIAATSANRSGATEARTAADVVAALDGAIDLILDGGPCRRGQPSTVVDVTGDAWRLVRAGALDARAIAAALA